MIFVSTFNHTDSAIVIEQKTPNLAPFFARSYCFAPTLLPQADVRSRNEFVNQALRFYIGYLTSEKIENYMLTTISSVMHATVKDSENRMARAMYKLAVETSKLSHVIAYSHGVDEQALGKLQAKCAEEVKRINGAVRFEEAYQYQQGDRF